MLICLCRSVSEQDVLDAASSGTLTDLFNRTGFGTECGACLTAIRFLIEENYPEQDDSDAYD